MVWITAPCHACLQCRSVPPVGKREDTQKYADPKVGGGRQEHLSGVYRFLQLQGETARHAAQTEKGGVCVAISTLATDKLTIKGVLYSNWYA